MGIRNYRNFSLLSLFATTLFAAIALSFLFPGIGPNQHELIIRIADQWHSYHVDDAAYGIHQEGGAHFLTISCSASNPSQDPTSCKLEFSIPFQTDPTPKLVPGATFSVPVYDEEYGNLNYFYYSGFGDMNDAELTVRKFDGNTINASLSFDGGTVRLWTDFQNQDITRSFD